MSKVFISFLGTSMYSPCRYQLDGFTCSSSVKFVQEALMDTVLRNWGKQDKIYIFVTKESEEKNWLRSYRFNPTDKQNPIEEPGLYQLCHERNLMANIEAVMIPAGLEDKEIWSIIKRIDERIQERDEVYFDITHSFRSIPMVVPAILNFLKTTKKITIGAIYYGAFEAKQKDTDIAPIRNLYEIYEMIEWSQAIDIFELSGDVYQLKRLINTYLKRRQEVDGKTRAYLLNLNQRLEKSEKAIYLNNIEGMKEVKDLEREDLKLNISIDYFPLNQALGLTDERFREFAQDDEIENGFALMKWSWKYKRYAQAITFAYETFISILYRYFEMDDKSCPIKGNEVLLREHIRFICEVLMGSKNIESYRAELYVSDTDITAQNMTQWFREKIVQLHKKTKETEDLKDLLKYFITLSNARHTVNHARKDEGNREGLIKKFEQIMDSFHRFYKRELKRN